MHACDWVKSAIHCVFTASLRFDVHVSWSYFGDSTAITMTSPGKSVSNQLSYRQGLITDFHLGNLCLVITSTQNILKFNHFVGTFEVVHRCLCNRVTRVSVTRSFSACIRKKSVGSVSCLVLYSWNVGAFRYFTTINLPFSVWCGCGT